MIVNWCHRVRTHARVLIHQRREVRIVRVLVRLTAWIVAFHMMAWEAIRVHNLLRRCPMHASAHRRRLRHALRVSISMTVEMRTWHRHMRVGEHL